MLSFLVSAGDAERIGTKELALIGETFTTALDLPDLQAELSLADLEDMQELNRSYRDIDQPTDVLSFQLLSGIREIRQLPKHASILLGSIVICPEKVEAYNETLPQMVEHGLLHLLGLDHETDMDAWLATERPILATLEERGLTIPEVPSL